MKKTIFKIISITFISLIVIQCGGHKSSRSVNHIVLVWFKENSGQNLIGKVMLETVNLQKIQKIKTLHIGRPIVSQRDIVDSSFDLGIFMNFASVDDMNAYLNDPRHVEFFKTYIEGKTRKLVVYDF